MRNLQGVFPPVPTPFDDRGDLDLQRLHKLLEALEPEVDGFLLLGSNGEAAFLSEEERREVVLTARAAIPRDKPLLVGTGGEATRLVQKRNLEAAELGADAVLVLPPSYYQGSMTEAALSAHYERLADESPLPLLLYNIPQATTLSLSPTLVARLARHPNIVGLKDSSGNVPALTEIMRQVPEDFAVLTGSAPTLLPALSLGARGGVLAVANVAAGAYRRILERFRAGDWSEARALQLRYNPLALAVTSQFGVPGLKAVLKLQGRNAGLPRPPLQAVSQEVETKLKGLLERLEAERPVMG